MSSLTTLKDWVCDKDFFGHTVTLNFDNKGDTHNTAIGGFFSLFIRAFITWYVTLNIYKLITFGGDNMQYTESLLNLKEMKDVDYDKTFFRIFVELKNHKYMDPMFEGRPSTIEVKEVSEDIEHMSPIFLHEKVERYIQPLFIANYDDWNEKEPEKRNRKNETKAKHCSADDFE